MANLSSFSELSGHYPDGFRSEGWTAGGFTGEICAQRKSPRDSVHCRGGLIDLMGELSPLSII